MQVALVGDDQRVDFEQRQIFLFEHLRQTEKDIDELLDLVTLQTQLERQLAPLIGLGAGERVDGCFQDLLRCFFGNLLDLDPPFGGRHEHDAAAGTVDDGTQIELIGDIGAGLHQNFAHRLPLGIGLVGHQTLAQPFSANALASAGESTSLTPPPCHGHRRVPGL